jgi:hypothetical protein
MHKVATGRTAAAAAVAVLTMGLMSKAEAAGPSVPPVAPHPAYRAVDEMELRVVGESAILRARPSPHGRVLSELHTGTKVIVLETGIGRWARVKANDMEGYVETDQGILALDLNAGF